MQKSDICVQRLASKGGDTYVIKIQINTLVPITVWNYIWLHDGSTCLPPCSSVFTRVTPWFRISFFVSLHPNTTKCH
jgi:hypothetical protein